MFCNACQRTVNTSSKKLSSRLQLLSVKTFHNDVGGNNVNFENIIQRFQSRNTTNGTSSSSSSSLINLNKILITHGHSSHVGGINEYSKAGSTIPIYKYPYFTTSIQYLGIPKNINFTPLKDGEIIQTLDKSSTIKTYHTPGHSRDSISFHLLEEDILFTGDTILPYKNFTDIIFEDLEEYIKSLKKLLNIVPKLIFPGHGDIIINPISTIEKIIKDQTTISEEIIQIIRKFNGFPDSKDILNELLSPKSSQYEKKIALGNIILHLKQLELEGKIEKRSKLEPMVNRSDILQKAKSKVNTDEIRGPGGLTMTQIFKLIQKNRENKIQDQQYQEILNLKDEKNRRKKNDQSLHPCHSELKDFENVVWALVL
ncbi:hypothetical protein G9A89_002702 [Geosiphon pyriformis]|nr:hypothetical protein G9A89_002702 [Geosiphon pyriformis]